MVYQIWEHQFWTHKLKKCQLTKKSLKPGLNSFILKQLYHWKSSQWDSHKAFFCVCVMGGGGGGGGGGGWGSQQPESPSSDVEKLIYVATTTQIVFSD